MTVEKLAQCIFNIKPTSATLPSIELIQSHWLSSFHASYQAKPSPLVVYRADGGDATNGRGGVGGVAGRTGCRW